MTPSSSESRFRTRSGAHWALALSLMLLCAATVDAAAERPTEYQIKAAFLYNFANFTTWPDSAFDNGSAPLVIGVLGDDPFNGALDQIGTKLTASGRPISITRAQDIEDLPRCHLLFVSRSESSRISEIINAYKDRGTLTISEIDRSCERGIMIEFFDVDKKIRFKVNLSAIDATVLRVDPRVLKLGRTISGGDR